jgi:HD-GYP domain-containing protein (c-di-GMP phosphodiesterase class II)
MRLTTTAGAAGRILARDVPSLTFDGPPLLRAGATISPRYQRALAEAGVREVWVHDALSDGVDVRELLPEPVRREAARRVAAALGAAAADLAGSQVLSHAALAELRAVVDLIAAAIAESSDVAMAVNDLAAADAHVHRHSLNVCALGLLIGRELFHRRGWVDWQGKARGDRILSRLAQLGLGLLLHDIGKLTIPAPLLTKRGLTAQEWKLVRNHPDAGVSLLPPGSSPLVKDVVVGHHERWNGSGYPRKLKGRDIHQFARIAAVADVYDEVTSARPYRPAAPAREGVRVIRDGRGKAFDPEIVDVFLSLVMPYPVGSELVLADGTEAVVVAVDPLEPERPHVRVPAGGGHRELRVDCRNELLLDV